MPRSLAPIRNDAEHDVALREIERLWGAKSGTKAGDRLEGLAILVDAYEETRFPMDPPDPIEAILFRLEQQGLDRRALARMIGSRGRVAEILGRRRDLSIRMVRRIHEELRIPAEILIRPTRRPRAKAA
jgi:HTH-type transcriptional regulator / antitoxin HigA